MAPRLQLAFLLLTLADATAALQQSPSPLSQLRSGLYGTQREARAPLFRTAQHGAHAARRGRTPPLTRIYGGEIVEGPPDVTTRAGSLIAGTYSGVMQFTFAAACASIVFGPVGLPIAIGIQHALVGFVIMQLIVTRLTSVRGGGGILAVPSFEVLPFLSRFAVFIAGALGGAAGAAAAPGSLLATVLVGSVMVNAMAAVLLAVASRAPVDRIDQLLPPALQAALFTAIGWSLYMLAFDTLGLASLSTSALFTWEAARLWLPANALGLGLWAASKKTKSPFLFPAFILATSALVHGARFACGASVEAFREGGWLMAAAAGAPCTQFFGALAPSLVRWDVLLSAASLKRIFEAALFGPVVNTVLNYVLLGPMIRQRIDLRKELRAHAIGTAAATAAGGYSNYLGISDTAIHRKIGGTDKRSCVVAAGVGALFLLAHPLCGAVGYLPTPAIAGICVFVGVDFLYDSLVVATRENGARAGLATAAIAAVCIKKDMLIGSLLGITAFQLADWRKRRRSAAAAAAQ